MIVLLVWFGESIEMCDRNAPRWKTERRKEKRERERETTSIRCRWCCGCGVDSICFPSRLGASAGTASVMTLLYTCIPFSFFFISQKFSSSSFWSDVVAFCPVDPIQLFFLLLLLLLLLLSFYPTFRLFFFPPLFQDGSTVVGGFPAIVDYLRRQRRLDLNSSLTESQRRQVAVYMTLVHDKLRPAVVRRKPTPMYAIWLGVRCARLNAHTFMRWRWYVRKRRLVGGMAQGGADGWMDCFLNFLLAFFLS